jgi:demethylmenaquinone methyltransferase/2-methoxy-6-polyprenyl-1,4-benzoquinol methylase
VELITVKVTMMSLTLPPGWHRRPAVAKVRRMSPPSAPEPTVSFGNREVPTTEKARLVREVFDSVAARYDLMNDLMSMGVHRLWKDVMIDVLAPRPGEQIVDVAGGTGDIAQRIISRTGGGVVVCDINPSMLAVGETRAINRGQLHGIRWIAADAERLPFADRRFDAYTIAFGLRNVTRPEAALAEALRVLKPGGRLLCLEFSRMTWPGAAEIYDTWSRHALPLLGRVVARDAEAYRYLYESIRRFPRQEVLRDMMRTAGFGQIGWRNLAGGIVALHTGWRI